MSDTLAANYQRLDQRIDSVLDSFSTQFAAILARAQTRTSLQLRGFIIVETDGTIKATASNLKALQKLPAIFRQALESEGYDRMVSNFLGTFNGGLPALERILGEVSKSYEVSNPDFGKQDQAFFDALKGNTSLNLEATIDLVAQNARQLAMFTVGGVGFEELAIHVADRLHVALGQAEGVAATGISTFYRTVAAQGYQQIEDELRPSGKNLRYRYHGPLDKLNREFCMDLEVAARKGQTWSREQIDAMDNGQLPNVFTSCGGYRCRHQWAVVLIGATSG